MAVRPEMEGVPGVWGPVEPNCQFARKMRERGTRRLKRKEAAAASRPERGGSVEG